MKAKRLNPIKAHDPEWEYDNSRRTDIRRSFERARKRMKADGARDGNITPIRERKQP